MSAHARRVLARLAKGTRARPAADGGFSIGAVQAPPALVDELCRRDLARRDDIHGLAITVPGEAALRRAAAVPRAPCAGQDAFAAQHRVLSRRRVATADGSRRAVAVNLAESPLYWLRARKDAHGRPLITQAQFEAGERLRGAYEAAHRAPAVTMRWDAPPLGRTPRGAPKAADATQTQLAAKRRVENALAAVGPGLADLLLRVCCHHQGLEAAERAFGWPQRSAKVVLGIALQRLAQHFGLE
ncbi:MAG: hypothetical protein D6782_01160 [Alphaproteobacteria bacterium]|nr:MAG: hypothetical protein D6782_01160 [Alphaproteobacteria bacterium]